MTRLSEIIFLYAEHSGDLETHLSRSSVFSDLAAFDRDDKAAFWKVISRPAAMKLRQGWRTPTLVLVRRGVGAKGHTPLTARDEIEFPSLPSLRILKEFIKRRGAAFLEALIRLQPATS